MNIGQAIRNLRTTQDMTQTELARRVGVSVNAVSAWELGKTYPPMGSIRRICQAFGVSEAYLNLSAVEEDTLPEDLRPMYRAFIETLRKAKLEKLEEVTQQ